MANRSILHRKYPEPSITPREHREGETTPQESISETLSVFEEKSQIADTLISEIKSSFRNLLTSGVKNLISEGSLTREDMQRIASNTPVNVGAELGGGYGLDLGLNVPSSLGKQDFQIKLTKSFEEGGEVSGVDWGFIKAREGGSQTKGYIPKEDGKVMGKSGLTIATGWDVGQMSLEELKSSGLPSELIDKVKPFAGLTGKKAQAKLEELGAPILKDDETSIVDAFTHNRALSQISENYEEASGKSFEDLSSAQQTVLASVGFQYGSNLEKVTPGFWKLATTGDWEGVHKDLMDFKDDYGPRRELEAGLLEKESIAAKLAEQAAKKG